jgi:hypothetical protein
LIKGNPVLSDEGDIGLSDADYAEISEQLLNGPYTSKKFLTLHKDCILSAHVNPFQWKRHNAVSWIKTGKCLISFAPEDDVQRRADLFTESSVYKSITKRAGGFSGSFLRYFYGNLHPLTAMAAGLADESSAYSSPSAPAYSRRKHLPISRPFPG